MRRRAFWIAYATIAAFVLLFTTVNALSVRDDQPGLRPWQPWVWEYTSAVVTIVIVPSIAWMLRIAPPGPGRWRRFALVHAPASVVYSLLHSGGYTLLRMAIYAALGDRYGNFNPFYEYRKDFIAYILFGAVFWSAGFVLDLRQRAHAAPSAPSEAAPALFDIRDGARVVRAPVAEIVAVNSAGNYVEFTLADGRKPLMRSTLGAVEAALEPHGFVRTHRSWLVNPARVREIAPEGSGDFRLELEGGAEAPLSRRFPEALRALRG
ncbi:MAG: response regulator transcription factor [Proteobacteria bacterium]|nr:response regulator transcription factor [Pseudomonadota bacterium]